MYVSISYTTKLYLPSIITFTATVAHLAQLHCRWPEPAGQGGEHSETPSRLLLWGNMWTVVPQRMKNWMAEN